MQKSLINTNKTRLETLYDNRMKHYNDLCSKLKILHAQKKALIESYIVVIKEVDKQISKELDGVNKNERTKE